MISVNILTGFFVLSNVCHDTTADVCAYVLTKDCAFIPGTSVCGTNGVTYRNSCYLAKAYCSDHSIHTAHDGACILTTTTKTTTTTTPTTNEVSTAAHSTAAISDPLSVICGTMGHVHCANDIEPICGSDDRTYVNRLRNAGYDAGSLATSKKRP